MNVLIVDAHPDDAEISCGGTISRLRVPTNTIWGIYFCPCTEDPRNVEHLKHHRTVCKFFGYDRLIGGNFPRNVLERYKQRVRDMLWKIKQELKPDLVLCPSPNDLHQDHKTVAECCLTIFRDTSTILGYEVLRSKGPNFRANFYVVLTHLEVKRRNKAIRFYKSQFKARPYFYKMKNFNAQARMNGVVAGAEWAEAFELLWGRIA